MGRRVEAPCSPDKVGSSRGRPRRAPVWPSSGRVGFTEKSAVRRPPCYLPLGKFNNKNNNIDNNSNNNDSKDNNENNDKNSNDNNNNNSNNNNNNNNYYFY